LLINDSWNVILDIEMIVTGFAEQQFEFACVLWVLFVLKMEHLNFDASGAPVLGDFLCR
jgi:hypothetical protein